MRIDVSPETLTLVGLTLVMAALTGSVGIMNVFSTLNSIKNSISKAVRCDLFKQDCIENTLPCESRQESIFFIGFRPKLIECEMPSYEAVFLHGMALDPISHHNLPRYPAETGSFFILPFFVEFRREGAVFDGHATNRKSDFGEGLYQVVSEEFG